MTATEKRDENSRLDRLQHEALNDLIAEQVTHVLGEPPNLRAVQVRHLWSKHYRVNIFVGDNIVSAKIVNSYFITADSEGRIVASVPPLAK
jgi:hypothetical protein